MHALFRLLLLTGLAVCAALFALSVGAAGLPLRDVIAAEPLARIDYVAVCDPQTLAPVEALPQTVTVPLIGTVAHEVGLDRALWVVVLLTAGIFGLAGTARNPRPARTGGPVRG